jgi:hypothetical protein
MNGERQVSLAALSVIAFCATVVIIILFVALWDYRELVALCLLILFVLGMLVWIFLAVARSLNEMSLRQQRYRHRDETPLDACGHPTHLKEGEQPYYAVRGYDWQQGGGRD